MSATTTIPLDAGYGGSGKKRCRSGPSSRKADASVTYVLSMTKSLIEPPAASTSAFSFPKHASACSTTPPATVAPLSSFGAWPAK